MSEPFSAYVEDVFEHSRILCPKLGETELVNSILEQMNARYLAKCGLTVRPSSMRDLRKLVMELEYRLSKDEKESMRRPTDRDRRYREGCYPLVEGVKRVEKTDDRDRDWIQGRCANCAKFGHYARECPETYKEKGYRLCFRCRRPGHVRSECGIGREQGNE